MNTMEIVLILLGILLFALGYFLPEKKETPDNDAVLFSEEEIKKMVDHEMSDAKSRIEDIVDETVNYAIEKTERSMDRLTNEKMLAVNEYSDTVLDKINKNHNEAVFLYDMLNDKHENLKNTVSEAEKTVSEVKTTVSEAKSTASEAKTEMSKAKAAASDFVVEQPTPLAKQNSTSLEKEEVDFQPIHPLMAKVIGKPEQTDDVGNNVEISKIEQNKEDFNINNFIKEDLNYVEDRDAAERKSKMEKKTKKASSDVNIRFSSGQAGRNSNEKILELHKNGKSNMAIAKELGLGIGEVKLVIDLFEGMG